MRKARLSKLDGQVLKFLFGVDEFVRVGIVGVLQSKAPIHIIKHGLGFPDSSRRLHLVWIAGVDAYRRATRASLLDLRLSTGYHGHQEIVRDEGVVGDAGRLLRVHELVLCVADCRRDHAVSQWDTSCTRVLRHRVLRRVVPRVRTRLL